MAIDTRKYDPLFMKAIEKHGFARKGNMIYILKAIVMVESSFQPRAYRFEPELFKRLKEKEPYWADKDPSVVSASYGLAQILFTTAWTLGMKPDYWRKMTHEQSQELAEMLYDPERNIIYQTQLMRALLDTVWKQGVPHLHENLSAMDIALSRYNGGSWRNPDETGTLRNQKYVDKVWRAYADIRKKEGVSQ